MAIKDILVHVDSSRAMRARVRAAVEIAHASIPTLLAHKRNQPCEKELPTLVLV